MRVWIAAGLLLVAGPVFAAGNDRGAAETSPPVLTGNLEVDFFGLTQAESAPPAVQGEGETPGWKSPWIAAGMSLIIPGSGEAYAGSYWKAAAFFAVEVAAWTVAYTQDKRGDRQTDFFQNFANEHWSVVDYAEWSEQKFGGLIGHTYAWRIPGAEWRAPWDQVNWDELNRMERAIAATASGQYYSHVLPRWNEQQYYELIGKYGQFNQGWDDRPADYTYLDPVTANFSWYAVERGKANDYYSAATTAVTIAILNHLLSAIDAAWTAGSANSVQARVDLQSLPIGGRVARVPTARVMIGF